MLKPPKDPLQGFKLKEHKCRGCGAELKMVDQGVDAQHRWMLYHAEPVCEWFGKQRALRAVELAREQARKEGNES